MQELNDPQFLEELIEETDGVQVVYGFEKTWGHLGTVDGIEFENPGVYRPDHAVKVPTGRLTDLEQDAEIEVDGELYTIIGHQRWDDGAEADFSADGALTVIFLKPAAGC